MQPATVTQLKQTLRKAHLKRLRSWAKAQPTQLNAASQQVCDHLYSYIQSRLAPPSSSAPCTSSLEGPGSHLSGTPPTSAPPLFIFAYLPLYYEVDLVPLMRQLWSTAQAQNVRVLTPVILPHFPCSSSSTNAVGSPTPSTVDAGSSSVDLYKSAMAFVEVFDEADLTRAFAPQGEFHIREFPRALLEPWLAGPEPGPSARKLTRGEVATADVVVDEGSGAALAASQRDDRRVRHMVLCDRYARLFPEAHAAGYRPAGLLEYTHKSEEGASGQAPADAFSLTDNDGHSTRRGDCAGGELSGLEDVSMLVLAPGVLFNAETGDRIGKGRGYYDRFLSYHARHRLPRGASGGNAETLAGRSGSTVDTARWEVVAVAFDSQVLHSAAVPHSVNTEGQLPDSIPVNAQDQMMHAVVTPSGGVERVGGKASREQ